MTITSYFTDLDIENGVCLKRETNPIPGDTYTGRDLVLIIGHNWIVLKDAKPAGIEHLIAVLQEKLNEQFVKNPEGKWRNRYAAV